MRGRFARYQGMVRQGRNPQPETLNRQRSNPQPPDPGSSSSRSRPGEVDNNNENREEAPDDPPRGRKPSIGRRIINRLEESRSRSRSRSSSGSSSGEEEADVNNKNREEAEAPNPPPIREPSIGRRIKNRIESKLRRNKTMPTTVPKPGPAKLRPGAGLDEWLEEAKQCHYLPEAVMKQLCEMVKEVLMEGEQTRAIGIFC